MAKTDFDKHAVPFEQIMSGGVGQGSHSIHRSIPFRGGGTGGRPGRDRTGCRADQPGYPLSVLTWHEIVNDVIAGVPVAATF
jgi:hypothetical protein